MSPLIQASGLAYSRQGRTILRDVELSVASGELVTLIGPNGAGKSTLVQLLLGLLRPDAGQVQRAPGLRIGYMPQKLNLEPHLPLSVRRFLGLANTRSADLAELCKRLHIGGLLDRPVQGISGGELQRVLMVRALMSKPNLLVLDEPVQGIDISGQSDMYRHIVELRDDTGCGVLMISHDLHLVMASTDTVVCLNQHICCHGHPDTISSDPAYLELFGKPQDATLAVYRHHHDHTHDHENCDHDAGEQH